VQRIYSYISDTIRFHTACGLLFKLFCVYNAFSRYGHTAILHWYFPKYVCITRCGEIIIIIIILLNWILTIYLAISCILCYLKYIACYVYKCNVLFPAADVTETITIFYFRKLCLGYIRLHLVPRLRTSGAIPLLPLCAFMALAGKMSPFALVCRWGKHDC
jgi:hypothetical protein